MLIVARRIAHPSKKEIPNVAVGQAQPLADEPEHGGGGLRVPTINTGRYPRELRERWR